MKEKGKVIKPKQPGGKTSNDEPQQPCSYQIRRKSDGSFDIWAAGLCNPDDPLREAGGMSAFKKLAAAKNLNGYITVNSKGNVSVRSRNLGNRKLPVRDELFFAAIWAIQGEPRGDGWETYCVHGKIAMLEAALKVEKAKRIAAAELQMKGKECDPQDFSEELDYPLRREEGVLLLNFLISLREFGHHRSERRRSRRSGPLRSLVERIESRLAAPILNSAVDKRDFAILQAIEAVVAISKDVPRRYEIERQYNQMNPDLLTKSKLSGRLKALGFAWIPAGRK